MSHKDQPAEAGDPGSTTYGLKKSETELLIFLKTHMDAMFSGVLSTIAADRLAYPISENTQFALMEGMTKVRISERVPQAPTGPEDATSSPAPANTEGPVKAA